MKRARAAALTRAARDVRFVPVDFSYHTPAWLLWVVGPIVRLVGEPLRSAFTPEAMRALLGRHGFRAGRDEDVRALGARSTPEIARWTRPITHLRIVTADRST